MSQSPTITLQTMVTVIYVVVNTMNSVSHKHNQNVCLSNGCHYTGTVLSLKNKKWNLWWKWSGTNISEYRKDLFTMFSRRIRRKRFLEVVHAKSVFLEQAWQHVNFKCYARVPQMMISDSSAFDTGNWSSNKNVWIKSEVCSVQEQKT